MLFGFFKHFLGSFSYNSKKNLVLTNSPPIKNRIIIIMLEPKLIKMTFEGVLKKEPGEKMSEMLAGSSFTSEQSRFETSDKTSNTVGINLHQSRI